MAQSLACVVVSLLCALLATVHADSFLKNSHLENNMVSLEARSEELQAALGAVLGCTGGPSDGESTRAALIRESLTPIWKTLPKNRHGRVEWRLVRYMAHRHFMHQFGVLVRGLEPSIQVNSSYSGEAEILSQEAPGLAKQIAASPAEHGFSLEDAAVMVAALEHFLFDSDTVAMEKIYHDRGYAFHQSLNRKEMQTLMMDYFVRWMLGEDQESATILLKEPTLLAEHVPHWDAITSMVEGSVTALEFSRLQAQRPGFAHNAFGGQFTFEDALQVAGSIGRSFAFFWEAQCLDIKASLMAFDYSGSGRVRLSDFYGANKDGEWRFGESEEYLRELGALDETSSWRGKQVMVPNYMQAVSNCIVTRPHYLVCCLNECEEIVGQVEVAVGAPVATVTELLRVVGDLTNGDDEAAKIDDAMRDQLRRIASMHGGQVPLHGRLFAQWLHYAFPRDCAFPHKAGAAATRTPLQYGDNFAVSPEDVDKHVAEDIIAKDLGAVAANASEDWEWMPQWSEEEELLTDYSLQLREPWSRTRLLLAAAMLVGLAGLLSRAGKSTKSEHASAPHAHFV